MNNDLISREALKETLTSETRDNFQFVCLSHVLEKIDNAQAVEAKQDELLDYIKLSLKHSDELKEKYRNKHKESNSQHDLYYSHLFEGMAEAYDDLLKKMGESEPVIEKDTYQIRKAYERGFETGIYAKSKEAIGVIEDLTKALEDNGIIAQAPEIKEALTMGIEALKREGKSDKQGESKQGEWIPMSTDCRGYSESFKCSICGAYIYPRYLEKELDYNLCPYCGADMGGKEE